MRKPSSVLKKLFTILVILTMVLPTNFNFSMGMPDGPPGGGDGPPAGGDGPPAGGGMDGPPEGMPEPPAGSDGPPAGFEPPEGGTMPEPPAGFEPPEGTVPKMPEGMTMPPEGTMPKLPEGMTMPTDGTMPKLPEGMTMPPGMTPPEGMMPNLPEGMTPEQMKQMQDGAMPPDIKAQMEKAGLSPDQLKIMEQMKQGLPLTESQIQEIQGIQTKMQGTLGLPENMMPGMEMPGGKFVATYAEGVLPIGMTMPEGMKVPEKFQMPVGFELPEGMSIGNIIPKGMELPKGMKLPTQLTGTKIDFNVTKGIFTGTDGKTFDIAKAIMPDMMKNQNMQFEIPTMLNGALAPVYIENMSGKPVVPATATVKNELKKIIQVDLTSKTVNKTAFTEQFKAMNINDLQNIGKDTLESLYANVTPDKLDITDPLVQKQMDLVYQERNKALSISDVNKKLAELNKGGTQVLSIDPASLETELANLEAMKAKGITDPNMAKKIDEAIEKTKDAQLSQTRLLAIRQQVTQLTAIKEELVGQSKELLTTVSKLGLDFTSVEQQEIEKEIAASSGGTVADQQGKIKGLIEKYVGQLQGAEGIDSDIAIKLATLYGKSNNMAAAQEVLSQSLEENPNNDKVALELASLYENSKNLSEAANVLKGALNRDPLPQTQAKLAEVTREMGKPAEAKPLIESALVGLPKDAALYTEASNIYKAANDTATVKTFIDGEKTVLAVTPSVNKENVVVAQAEALAQSLGGNTKYDPKTQKMTITEGNTTIVMTAGNRTALVNGVNKVMETAPTVAKDGKLTASAQFIATSLQESFEYKADSKMMIIGGR